MRIKQLKNTQNFNGLYNNKFLLSSLEYISDHSATFAAGASFVGAVGLRPLAIAATPKVNKENKKILSAESIASALMKLAVALGISLPIEKAVKKIDTGLIKNLSNKEFKFLTQTIKQSANLISAIPKSILSVALIPIVADFLTFEKKDKKTLQAQNLPSFLSYKEQVNFKGGLSKLVSSVVESDKMQEFAIKHSKNDKNIARNFSAITDTILTAGSVLGVHFSKKIEDKNKKPLIINKVLSSLISILAGCSIDKLAQKLGSNFVENFKKENLNNPKLLKYIDGLNVARPTLIFALIYYGIIPVFTTFLSEKVQKDK